MKALLAALAVTVATPAVALDDPYIFSQIGLTVDGNYWLTAGTRSIGGTTVDVGLAPAPYVRVTAAEGGRVGYGEIIYDYLVLLDAVAAPPTRLADIVDIDGLYELRITSGYAEVRAGWSIDRNAFFSQQDPWQFREAGYTVDKQGSFNISGGGELIDPAYMWNGTSHAAYRGSLKIKASIWSLGFTGTTTAFIDPVITVDQQQLQALGLTGGTVLVSPGVGNGSVIGAVPEPGQWALLVIGFGIVGSAFRRRSRPSRRLLNG